MRIREQHNPDVLKISGPIGARHFFGALFVLAGIYFAVSGIRAFLYLPDSATSQLVASFAMAINGLWLLGRNGYILDRRRNRFYGWEGLIVPMWKGASSRLDKIQRVELIHYPPPKTLESKLSSISFLVMEDGGRLFLSGQVAEVLSCARAVAQFLDIPLTETVEYDDAPLGAEDSRTKSPEENTAPEISPPPADAKGRYQVGEGNFVALLPWTGFRLWHPALALLALITLAASAHTVARLHGISASGWLVPGVIVSGLAIIVCIGVALLIMRDIATLHVELRDGQVRVREPTLWKRRTSILPLSEIRCLRLSEEPDFKKERALILLGREDGLALGRNLSREELTWLYAVFTRAVASEQPSHEVGFSKGDQ